MTIPTEIRREIYGHLFGKGGLEYIFTHVNVYGIFHSQWNERWNRSPILCTCRQVYEEAIEVLYQRNTFLLTLEEDSLNYEMHLYTPPHNFSFCRPNFQHIKNLRISFDVAGLEEFAWTVYHLDTDKVPSILALSATKPIEKLVAGLAVTGCALERLSLRFHSTFQSRINSKPSLQSCLLSLARKGNLEKAIQAFEFLQEVEIIVRDNEIATSKVLEPLIQTVADAKGWTVKFHESQFGPRWHWWLKSK